MCGKLNNKYVRWLIDLDVVDIIIIYRHQYDIDKMHTLLSG